MPSIVVLDCRIFWNTKTFKIPTKLDAYAMDAVLGLNDNEQDPGGINKDFNVTNEQELK